MCLVDWVFARWNLTAASADSLMNLPTAACAVSLCFLLVLTLEYFVEGRRGVNGLLLREAWLIAVDTCSNSGSYASKRDRNASIKYETMGAGDDFSGEEFQNIGTFIVVRSSVFVKSSAHKIHRARRL